MCSADLRSEAATKPLKISDPSLSANPLEAHKGKAFEFSQCDASDANSLRDQLADGGCNRLPVDAVLDEVVVGAEQKAILLRLAAVALQLDLQPVQDFPG